MSLLRRRLTGLPSRRIVLVLVYSPALAPVVRRWVEPFLASFSDLHMRIVELVSENETVVGRFTCSGTHTGTWMGHPATGRRFTDVAEVYFDVLSPATVLPGRP